MLFRRSMKYIYNLHSLATYADSDINGFFDDLMNPFNALGCIDR